MKVFDIIERFKLLDKYLKKEKTGSSNEFASKLGISRSMLFCYFDFFRSYGISIKFEKKKNSYVYQQDFEVEIKDPIKIIRNVK